ncbi:hypothetical protein [Sphingobacterium sp. G1-14]|uniref:hypothetical protein n=1 Tax=unclassified Sphingobacterium TaxID=2609468 RepID=UPI000B48CDB0|nr:hypothetical protein [Sphingobacterium sp. G1-14]
MNKTIKVPPILIKIGRKEDLVKLQQLGQVYFGTFEGYRTQEKEEFQRMLNSFLNKEDIDLDQTDFYRRDPLEGLERRFSGSGSIRFKSKDQKDITINIPEMKLNLFQNKYSHLYCLYAIPNVIDDTYKIDSKMLKFGESALIITKPLEFLERLIGKIESNYDMDHVSYYDNCPMFAGKYEIFQKQKTFEYQNEFRIAVNLIEDNSVFIGDITDISILLDSQSLLESEYKIQS